MYHLNSISTTRNLLPYLHTFLYCVLDILVYALIFLGGIFRLRAVVDFVRWVLATVGCTQPVKINAAILRGINHSQIPALAGMSIDIPVTVSDSCAQGQREDISGQAIKDIPLALLA